MTDDVVRQGTADLAARLAQPTGVLQGPPPRAPAPPPPVEESDGADERGEVDAAPLDERRGSGPAEGEEPAAAPPARGRRRAAPTPAREDASSRRDAAAVNPAVNITVTLTNEAAVLLERAREGSTVREALVGAVRETADELRRAHPKQTDPSGAIPMVRVKARRRLEGYGRKVPVRLYVVERDAIYELADDLEITVSALVTEALERRYGSAEGRASSA